MTDLRRVFDDLIRFETELWDGIDSRLRAELGLPMGNFDVMQVIDRTPSCRVHDIARALSITVGGTSKAVDRVERLGHCVRKDNPADRRSSLVELTRAGRSLLVRAATSFEDELERRIGAVLTPRQLQQLASSLTRLRAYAVPEQETTR